MTQDLFFDTMMAIIRVSTRRRMSHDSDPRKDYDDDNDDNDDDDYDFLVIAQSRISSTQSMTTRIMVMSSLLTK